ncbi:MAG: Do family serine endopeptidase [Gammaproteobacteria bacterium]|nr:Do family serine endopeptidase [Gammaproteobacteria bacterium]MYD79029.1 Do family serine endopeptidase [Gammaproteobacteria bacterium]
MLGNSSRVMAILLLGVFCVAGYVHGLPLDGRTSLAPMLEDVTPAVVNIKVTKLKQVTTIRGYWGPFPQRETRRGTSAGSGLIVDAEAGYVVTNHHVVDEAEKIVVTLLDRREFEATVIGSDRHTDVAVLKIDATDLQELEFGDSDELRVGDFVVAIGNPFGFGQTVTSGIVSALGRTGLGIERYEDFIQTDASINPGNSGGPLVDLEGNVIGINTAIIGTTGSIGIGFAIPSNMVTSILSQLIEHGQVSRGVLGIGVEEVTQIIADINNLESLKGALVDDVIEGSSADRAGLKINDVIVAIDDEEVLDHNSLIAQLGLKRVGEVVKVEFVRNGSTRSIQAELTEVSDILGTDVIPQFKGVVLGELKPSHESYKFTQEKGVVVKEVETTSSAFVNGLRKNDVITHVGRARIVSLEQFHSVVKELEEIHMIRVARKNRTLPIVF